MTNQLKEILNELSKDQLIYLIEQYYHSQFLISEVCVEEYKPTAILLVLDSG